MKWYFGILVFLFFGLPLFWSGLAFSQDLQRGLRNYQEILSGRKKFEQLSPQEQNEVKSVKSVSGLTDRKDEIVK